MNRGLIIGLVISVVLNVFAVGFISGRVINQGASHTRHEMPKRNHSMGQSFRLMHFADALPSERRDEFRKAFYSKLPTMRGDFREMKILRKDVSSLLGQEEWDRAAIQAKFDELQALQQRQHVAFSAAFLDAFETLTPEERQLLREAAAKRKDGRGRRLHRRDERGRRHQPDLPPPPPEEE